jgi:rhodanese-related sulfurtransferase
MVDEITVTELSQELRAPSRPLLVLDVRENSEREVGHIEPSLHIPMGQVSRRVGEIPKDRRIVVYCHHGGRSAMVAAYLDSAGYKDVANLTGGIDAWSSEIDPQVPRYS